MLKRNSLKRYLTKQDLLLENQKKQSMRFLIQSLKMYAKGKRFPLLVSERFIP